MSNWAVWQIDPNHPEHRRQIGELYFNPDGSVDLNTESRELLNFMNRIDQYPVVDGEEVSTNDPAFDLALVQHITQTSDNRYVLDPLPDDEPDDDDHEDDEEEDDGSQPSLLPTPPTPTSGRGYKKVPRL